MTAFEQYINISKKRQRYEENKEVIDKLKSKLLDDFDITPAELIKKSIDKVKLEQEAILKELKVNDLKEMLEMEKKALSKVEFKNMKKNRYSSMKDSFSKYEETKNRKAKEEAKRKELEETKMDARDIIIKTKTAIRKLENRIDKADAEETKFLVKELEIAIEGNNTLEIKDRINKLKEKDEELAEKFYDKFNGRQESINEEDIIDYEDEVIEVEENIDDEKTEVLTSDMKRNRDDDKTDVLTSDMKKEVYDENKIEALDTESVRRVVFKNARVEFDGEYKLYYNDDRDVYVFDRNIEKIESELKRNIMEEAAYDYNIIAMLKDFDRYNNTKLYERYMQNKLPVKYDIDASKNNKTKKSISKKLDVIINRQKEMKEFNNVTVVRAKNNKKKNIRAVATAIGLAAIAFIGAMGFGKKNTVRTFDSDKAVINTIDDAGDTDAIEECVEVSSEEEVTTEAIDYEVTVNPVEEVAEVEVKEDIQPEIDTTIEDKIQETKIGDMITFDDTVSLYYASTDINPNGNTSYLESDNYKIGLVSIVYEGQVVEYVDSSDVSVKDLIEECKEKYGDSIQVFDNLDLVDDNGDIITKQVGWVEDEELGKVLRK